MSDSVRVLFDKLPTMWKLSVVRCLFYCIVQAVTGIISGLDGYTSFAEISWFSWFKLACAVLVDVLMTWIAFIDQSLKGVPPNTQTTTVTTASNVTATAPLTSAPVSDSVAK